MFHVPNKYRIKYGNYATFDSDGNIGAFLIPFENNELIIIASDGMEWEHVSVSLKNRCPNWKEMCFIKNLFWDPEDTVIQYHPPQSEYINNNDYCLHLWKPVGKEIIRPPSILVGIK